MALAMISRSPNNWVSSFRYGVSPHPAHAPENSNSGCRNCDPRTVPKSTRDALVDRAGSTKNAKFSRSASEQLCLRLHVDRFVLRRLLVLLRRTYIDAQAAAGAILGATCSVYRSIREHLRRASGVGREIRRAHPAACASA